MNLKYTIVMMIFAVASLCTQANASGYSCSWMEDAGEASLILTELEDDKAEVKVFNARYRGTLEICSKIPTGTDELLIQYKCHDELGSTFYFTLNKYSNEVSDIAIPASNNIILDWADCEEK